MQQYKFCFCFTIGSKRRYSYDLYATTATSPSKDSSVRCSYDSPEAFRVFSIFQYAVSSRPTIPRLDSVTYFRPGSCGGKISFKFSDKKFNCATLTAHNFFGGNFIKIMK